MKLLPIGISDFKGIIDKKHYYIDKTLLVKELLETGGQVILIPRPRRFGKTLNLSMLKYFFEENENDNSYLFKDTAIWKDPKFKEEQGRYPVIFLTFKDVKEANWEGALYKIKEVISKEFKRHFNVLQKNLRGFELEKYNSIKNENAPSVVYTSSIFFLSELLYQHHKQKTIILIDEYDAPINTGYNNNFYEEVVSFMRSLLSGALKDNVNLERGVLTGILRTAKEGIFSGLNNLKVCSILDTEFQDKFGFTTQEVEKLLKDYDLSNQFKDVQQWYNGYTFGETIIYNPWSIISFVDKKGRLGTYWSNTSDNMLIKKIIALSDESVKEKFESLLSGVSVKEKVDQGTIYPEIEKNNKAIWSLLLFAGYLTCKNLEVKEVPIFCDLIIPNKEIRFLFDDLINEIFGAVLNAKQIEGLKKAIINGDEAQFSDYLQKFIENSMSYFDIGDKEPEKSYHLFVLGLLVILNETHTIKSNRESGAGRYDIMLIPKNKQDLGVIIEFKKVREGENIVHIAESAISQIKEKDYAQELRSCNVNKIKAYGIACEKKKIFVLAQDL